MAPTTSPSSSSALSSSASALADPRLRALASRRFLILAVLSMAYLFVFFHRLSPAVIALDLMRDLGMGSAALGILSSAYFYPYALMQLPAGLLADSWGPRRTVTIFFLLAGVGALIFGLAGGLGTAMVSRALVGAGVAMVFVPTLKILVHWYPPAQFQGMTGILLAVGGVGMYVAATPLAWLSEFFGWRATLVAIGALTLGWSGLLWFVVRNRPSELGLPEPNQATAAASSEPAMSLWQGTRLVASEPAFWPLAVWFAASAGTFFSFGGLWGGPFLVQAYGLSKPAAGGVLAMLALGMIVTNLAVGSFSAFFERRRAAVLRLAALAMLVQVLWLTLWPLSMNLPMLYVWFFFFSCFSNSLSSLTYPAVKDLFPVSIAGTATGLLNIFPFLGAMIMQPLVGWLLQAQGGGEGGAYPATAYANAFWAYVVASVVAVAAAGLIRPVKKA